MPIKNNVTQFVLRQRATFLPIPALSAGLALFTLFLLIWDTYKKTALSEKFRLYPSAPFELNLNCLSFYLLFHESFLHWFFAVLVLFIPMANFEKSHGTVYTGIVLNVLTVVSGLQYCIVGYFMYPVSAVVGLSGAAVFFATYMAYEGLGNVPLKYTFEISDLTTRGKLPTYLLLPYLILLFYLPVATASLIWLNFASIVSGCLLVTKKISYLTPPQKVIVFLDLPANLRETVNNGYIQFVPYKDAPTELPTLPLSQG